MYHTTHTCTALLHGAARGSRHPEAGGWGSRLPRHQLLPKSSRGGVLACKATDQVRSLPHRCRRLIFQLPPPPSTKHKHTHTHTCIHTYILTITHEVCVQMSLVVKRPLSPTDLAPPHSVAWLLVFERRSRNLWRGWWLSWTGAGGCGMRQAGEWGGTRRHKNKNKKLRRLQKARMCTSTPHTPASQ